MAKSDRSILAPSHTVEDLKDPTAHPIKIRVRHSLPGASSKSMRVSFARASEERTNAAVKGCPLRGRRVRGEQPRSETIEPERMSVKEYSTVAGHETQAVLLGRYE